MNQMTAFLSLLAQALLVLGLPILIAGIFMWLRDKSAVLRGRITQDQLSALQSISALAVRAAEQAGLSKQIAGGLAKKEYAIQAAQDYLNSRGIKVDVRTVANVIEAEVLKQFNNAAPPVDTPQARAALLDKAVESAVLAAEQSGLKALAASGAVNLGASLAEQKKQYAVNAARKYLEDQGLRVDPTVIDSLIEAQIMRFKMLASQGLSK